MERFTFEQGMIMQGVPTDEIQLPLFICLTVALGHTGSARES